MADKILMVKLEEMDREISGLHSKILRGEQLPEKRLQEEITGLRIDVEERGKMILRSLCETRMELPPSLMEKFEALQKELACICTEECGCEREILTAEYEIDFAILAAKHALLKSLEAIRADRIHDREEDSQ